MPVLSLKARHARHRLLADRKRHIAWHLLVLLSLQRQQLLFPVAFLFGLGGELVRSRSSEIEGVQSGDRTRTGGGEKGQRRGVVEGADDDGRRLADAVVEGGDGLGQVLSDGGADSLNEARGEKVGDDSGASCRVPRDFIVGPRLSAERKRAANSCC